MSELPNGAQKEVGESVSLRQVEEIVERCVARALAAHVAEEEAKGARLKDSIESMFQATSRLSTTPEIAESGQEKFAPQVDRFRQAIACYQDSLKQTPAP